MNVQSDATGAVVRFSFLDSVHNHDRGVDQLDRDALLGAFWSFVGDAQAG